MMLKINWSILDFNTKLGFILISIGLRYINLLNFAVISTLLVFVHNISINSIAGPTYLPILNLKNKKQ